jgi:hypothetical protein
MVLATALRSFAFLTCGASASEFLRQKTQAELQTTMREAIERSLMAELKLDSARLQHFEDELRPMYTSLPKNENGLLDPPAVRYALHRYFVHKHGWNVVGLDPLGQSWNTTDAAGAGKGKVPAYVQGLLEKRQQGKGMPLHDVAAFAATMLDFVHNEALADVMDLYKALELETDGPVTQAQADRVVQGYILQILDGNMTVESDADVDKMEHNLNEWFPDYPDFVMWAEDARKTKSFERLQTSLVPQDTSLDGVIADVNTLNDHLFQYQDIECRRIKAGMMDLQHGDSGRVLLADFYAAGLKGEFLFVEHPQWLRNNGAIDDTDPNHPSVIISNFLISKANCLTETSFHSVCCMDECQGLLSHLESAIAAPVATPARIAELIAGLPSDTIDAPRNLSSALMSRLGEISDLHDGHIPLHGRLFAQWMHHAYPLECPYPHASGTFRPETQDEWMEKTGAEDITATEEDRTAFSKLHKPVPAELPWMQLEELVSQHKQARGGQSQWASMRKIAAFAAVMAMAASIAGVSSRFIVPGQSKTEKFMV